MNLISVKDSFKGNINIYLRLIAIVSLFKPVSTVYHVMRDDTLSKLMIGKLKLKLIFLKL